MNNFLDNYIDDAEYILAYNKVIKSLDKLNMDYNIELINKLPYSEIIEAAKQFDRLRFMLKRI